MPVDRYHHMMALLKEMHLELGRLRELVQDMKQNPPRVTLVMQTGAEEEGSDSDESVQSAP